MRRILNINRVIIPNELISAVVAHPPLLPIVPLAPQIPPKEQLHLDHQIQHNNLPTVLLPSPIQALRQHLLPDFGDNAEHPVDLAADSVQCCGPAGVRDQSEYDQGGL